MKSFEQTPESSVAGPHGGENVSISKYTNQNIADPSPSSDAYRMTFHNRISVGEVNIK